MPTLSDYYRDLLVWEGVPHVELVAKWPAALIQSVEAQMRHAVELGMIVGRRCPLRQGSKNQSIGNQIEANTMPSLSESLVGFKLEKCAGAGYPDQMLTEIASRLRIAFEVKATSDWNVNDSNRRVLTSSSEKIRREFNSPVHHLLLTILYVEDVNEAVIEHFRFDFLEPTTQVSVRLEASVSHKTLSQGSHTSLII